MSYTTAQIYWLKNRKPEQWREKREVEISNTQSSNKLDEILGEIKAGDTGDASRR